MWNSEHREKLYEVIQGQWAESSPRSFEEWMKGLGIEWAELRDEAHDAPRGTVAVWEGPGFTDENLRQCWVVPDEVAMKLLVLGAA